MLKNNYLCGLNFNEKIKFVEKMNKLILILACCLICVNVWALDYDFGKYPNILDVGLNDSSPGTYKLETGSGDFYFRIPQGHTGESQYCSAYFKKDDGRRLYSDKSLEFEFRNKSLNVGYDEILFDIWPVKRRRRRVYDDQLKGLSAAVNLQVKFGSASYGWHETDWIIYKERKHNYDYNWNDTIPSDSMTVKVSDIWKIFKSDTSAKNEYDRMGYIDIYFRYVFYVDVSYHDKSANSHTDRHVKGYFQTHRSQIRVYRCSVGDMSVDTAKNPMIDSGVNDTFAIYPKQTGPVSVLSDVHYNSKASVCDVVRNVNTESEKSIQLRRLPSDSYSQKDWENNISIENFKTNGKLQVGDVFEVHRKVKIPACSSYCESNSVMFKVVEAPTVGQQSDSVIVCRDGQGDIEISGVAADFGNYDEKLYAPSYRWVYWTDKNPMPMELKVSDGSSQVGLWQLNEENTPNLRVSRSALKEGTTYYFRQRVYMTAFGPDVYEEPESGACVTVRLAKKLDPKLLSLKIDTGGVRLSRVCAGDYLGEVRFSAVYGGNENPKDYGLDKFSFSCERDGARHESEDSVDWLVSNLKADRTVLFRVTMRDGCGDSISALDSIQVQALPAFGPENIVRNSDNVDVKYAEEDGERLVRVIGVTGRECKLKIGDAELSSHSYRYHSEDGAQAGRFSPYLKTYFQSDKQAFYAYKQANWGCKCESPAVRIEVIGREDISGNRFVGVDTIFVCAGSALPEITDGRHISSPGMSGNVEFAYRWKYSIDGYSFSTASNVSGEMAGASLKGWERTVKEGEVLYLKREVSAGYGLNTLDPTVLSTHSSDTVVVTTFSDPKVGLDVSGDLSGDGESYCHGDTVVLRGSVSSRFDSEQNKMRRDFDYPKYRVSYYDYVKEDGEYSYVGLSGVDKDGRFVAEGYHNIHAGVAYCGDTVYTEGSRPVSALGKLDVVTSAGNCVTLGDSVGVTAALDGAEVAIVRGGDTLAWGGGSASAMLHVDKQADLKYQVLVRDVASGCGAAFEKSIPAGSVEKRLGPAGIGVEGLAGADSVCAGEKLTIVGSDADRDGRYASFSWSVNGKPLLGESGRDIAYKFDMTSASYLVERTANYRRGGEFCYSVTDSVRLNTYGALEEPTVELSDDAVCHGGEVTVKVTANGGGQNGEYKVVFSPGEISAEEAVREGESVSRSFGNLMKNEQFYVSLSDAVCSSSMYSRISEKKLVQVEKDLSFSVSVASKVITSEDFDKGNIKIPFNFDGITKGDSMSYRVNGGKEVMFMYDGTALSLTLVDSTDFASGNVHLDFVHYGSVAGCSSEIVGYDISINEGFDGIPNITSAGIEDTIEVCAGTEVEMELSGLDDITFDEKPIEEMTGGVWTWYRNNSPVAGGSANGCVVKAEAGKSKTYYARFSAKDAGGKTRRLWSNPFTVIGKAPIKLEKIKFDNYQSQDFVEFCKGSDAKVTIASSQTFGKEVTLQWQYSENTADWTDVPSSWNGGVQTVGVKSISVPASVLGDKTTWFRLSVTDTCGQLAESNFLKVQFKGDVLSPSPVLTSTRIYDSESDIPVALEFARSMNHSPYRFLGATDDEGELEVSEVGGRQSVGHKDGSIYKWSFGENIVRAVGTALARVSNEVCYSDTVEYKFKLFQKLATPTLSKNPAKDTFFCAGDNDLEKFLTLGDIKGGDSTTYKTYWQYKLNDVWRDVEEGSNMSVFSAEIKDIMKGGQSYYQQLYIYDLNQTVSFRAIIDCEGGYPGTSVVSDIEQTFHVYSPMSDGGIDVGEAIACHGSYPDSIKGFGVSGGSGSFTYAWQWGKDDKSWEDVPECAERDFALLAGESGGKYRLTESAYFRRVVTDAVCGAASASRSKHVKVRPERLMSEDYFSHDRLVASGNSAKMQGITADPAPVDSYVWYSSPDVVHASSTGSEKVQSEVFRLPLGEESMKVTYYVQGIVNGCPTSNKIGFDMLVFNQSGGDVMFGGEDPETSETLVCGGDKDIVLQSVSAAPGATYEWQAIVDGTSAPVWSRGEDGKAKAVARGESLWLDTTTVSLTPKTEGQTVGFFRISWVGVGDDVVALSSDTLTVALVPALKSYSNAYAIFGNSFEGELEIKDHKQNYCLDDEAPEILGGVESDVLEEWARFQKRYSPLVSISTHYEYSLNGGEWVADESTRRSYPDYVSSYSVGSSETGGLAGDYKVRRVMTDGCSSVTTNEVAVNLFDDVLDTGSVVSYAFTPEMEVKDVDYAIRDGYEIGDSLVVRAAVSAGRFAWFGDEGCADTLSVGLSASFVLDSASLADNGAFVYVKAVRDGCYGEAVAVPFGYGTRSDGGTITIEDTVVCHNGEYGDIYGGEEPDGWYVSPVYAKMAWTYAWQYKWSDSEKAKWADIEGQTGEGLPAEVVNACVKEGGPLYIRRVATNDKGRVRYSNALRLTRHAPLVPGTVYADGRASFCTYDEEPCVKTTSASGGKVWAVYGVEWQYSVNGGGWTSVTVIDSLHLSRLSAGLDRSVDNTVSVRCLYSDECETVAGDPADFRFHRRNASPKIMQKSDSCNATEVKLAVYAEAWPKTYRWSALYDDPGTEEAEEDEIWYKDGETCTVVRSGLPTSNFGVRSTDLETGCVSDYFRFNVDSLPGLAQESPAAPPVLCPGEDLIVRGGALSGGNSEKSYRWQLSASGEDGFSDVAGADAADLLLESRFVTGDVYVRRIVTDMCGADTSEAVKVALREPVSVSAESLKLNDYRCENTTYTVMLEAEKDSAYASEWWTLGADTLRETGRLYQMVGFMGDSLGLPFVRHLTDSTGLTCRSEAVTVYARNRAKVDPERNTISTDDLMPCNDSYVRIEGEPQNGAHVTYRWYVNGEEQAGKTSASLSTRAQDTMHVSRVVTNGCESFSSDTLVLYGQKVYSHNFRSELSMDVVTDMADSSVTLNIANSKAFGDSYSFAGDGEMPQVTSNSVTLPYDCWQYRDSILDVRYESRYCFRPLQVTPLRGGVISFDGGTELCGGADVPAIIVTEIEGGDAEEELTYQWQRRNAYTPDFVNIEGATGKTYVPEAIDVETVYRRVATNGRYRSVSNELTLSIRPLPEVVSVGISYSEEEMDRMGLSHDRGYYEWLWSVETYLTGSFEDADEVRWEKSLDGASWVRLSAGDSLLLTDSVATAYYRAVAVSSCGADTGDVVRLVARHIEPLGDDFSSGTETYLCYETDASGYRMFALDCWGDAYMYSFHIDADSGDVYYMPYPYRAEDVPFSDCFEEGRVVLGYDCFSPQDELMEDPCIQIMQVRDGKFRDPACDIRVSVTRHDTLTGLSVSKTYLLETNLLKADYSIQVENGDEVLASASDGDIVLSQGNRVQFRSKASGNKDMGAVTCKWVLEEPMNVRRYTDLGGRSGLEGLTSELENPSCYYYNGGYYPMSLEVSDGRCTSVMRDTSLVIPQSSVRALYMESMSFAGGRESGHVDYVEVAPSIFTDHVRVAAWDGSKEHEAVMYDSLGRVVWSGSFRGEAVIPARDLPSAVYTIVVDEKDSWKVVKK